MLKNRKKTEFSIQKKLWPLLVILALIVIIVAVICGKNDLANNIVNDSEDAEDKKNDLPIANMEEIPEQIEIPQQIEAEYEKWLASAVLIGISAEYPDFELDGIYTESNTKLESSGLSKGVYVLFRSGNTKYAVSSVPLENEREEAGTIDIRTANIEYASFYVVKVKSDSVEGFREYTMEE